MKVFKFVVPVLLGAALLNPIAQAAHTPAEQEVLNHVSQVWEQARQANIDGMFASMPETDKGAYVMAGEFMWTRDETITGYQYMFEGVARQDIDMSRETITMLSDNSALYVGEGTFAQYNIDGQLIVPTTPQAVSVALQRIQGEWQIIHVHQSFPTIE